MNFRTEQLLQRVTSEYLQRVNSVTSNKRILQWVTSILQQVMSYEWVSTSNEQRVKSYASSLKLKEIHYLRANFLKIYFQFLTLDRQCNGFLRKIFCTITNFHNKLSKLAPSNRIHHKNWEQHSKFSILHSSPKN